MKLKIGALVILTLALCVSPLCALGESKPALSFQANRITLIADARVPVTVISSAACEQDIQFEYRYYDEVYQAVLPAGQTQLALELETPAVVNQEYAELEILKGDAYTLKQNAKIQLHIIEKLEFDVYGGYVFAYTGTDISVSFVLKTTRYYRDATYFDLRDEHGVTLATTRFFRDYPQQAFKFTVPTDWTGIRLVSVWMGDRKLSPDYEIIINSGASPICKVETDEPKMAICINCGSGSVQDAYLWMDLLDKYNAKASFFMVGIWVKHYPDLMNDILERGHEIGNHTMNHIRIPYAKPKELKEEAESVVKLIADMTDGYNTMLFSAPYGSWDSRVVSLLNYWGYTTVQFTVDSGDAISAYTTDKVYERAVSKDIGPGSIVLFHVSAKHFRVMDDVLTHYTSTLGLQLVRVSDLLPKGGYTVDKEGVARAIE